MQAFTDSKNDIKWSQRSGFSLRNLLDKELWDVPMEAQRKAFDDFVAHDRSQAASGGAMVDAGAATSNRPVTWLDSLTDGLMRHNIEQYNSARSDSAKLATDPGSMARHCAAIRGFVTAVLEGAPVSQRLRTFKPLYKRKAGGAARILVSTDPTFNIAYRCVKDIMLRRLLRDHPDVVKFASYTKYHVQLQEVLRGVEGYVVLFLDFAKAFDSVYVPKVVEAMEHYGLGEFACFVRFLQECEYEVTFEGSDAITSAETIRYGKRVGVPQGLSISSLVFAVLVRYVLTGAGINPGSTEAWRTTDTAYVQDYVDDLLFVTRDPKDLNTRFVTMIERFEEVGLRLNGGKCKMLVQGFDASPELRAFRRRWRFATVGRASRDGAEVVTEKYLGRYYAHMDTDRNMNAVSERIVDDIMAWFKDIANKAQPAMEQYASNDLVKLLKRRPGTFVSDLPWTDLTTRLVSSLHARRSKERFDRIVRNDLTRLYTCTYVKYAEPRNPEHNRLLTTWLVHLFDCCINKWLSRIHFSERHASQVEAKVNAIGQQLEAGTWEFRTLTNAHFPEATRNADYSTVTV